jgi:hypothetical protein
MNSYLSEKSKFSREVGQIRDVGIGDIRRRAFDKVSTKWASVE